MDTALRTGGGRIPARYLALGELALGLPFATGTGPAQGQAPHRDAIPVPCAQAPHTVRDAIPAHGAARAERGPYDTLLLDALPAPAAASRSGLCGQEAAAHTALCAWPVRMAGALIHDVRMAGARQRPLSMIERGAPSASIAWQVRPSGRRPWTRRRRRR